MNMNRINEKDKNKLFKFIHHREVTHKLNCIKLMIEIKIYLITISLS